MIRSRRWLLAGAVAGLLPLASPFAARSAVQQDVEGANPGTLYVGRAADPKPTYEQLEIMKRILSQKLAYRPRSGHDPLQGQAVSPLSHYLTTPAPEGRLSEPLAYMPPAQANPLTRYGYGQPPAAGQPEVDGVYLPGVGLVYTLRMSQADRLGGAAGTAAKPADLWELAQRQMADAPKKEEKKEAKAAAEPTLKDQLVECILKTLGEYGHRLTTLGEGERVIVVVTLAEPISWFHGAAVPAGGALNSEELYEMRGAATAAAAPVGVGPSAASPATPPTAASAPLSRQGALDLFVPVDDETTRQLKLGELHLRQGRYEEAKAAFERALAASQQSQSESMQADAYRRLAELAVAQNQLGNAQELLRRAQALKKAADARASGMMVGSAAAASGAGRARPLKLIVSLPVSAMRRLGKQPEGGWSTDDLRKSATIDLLELPYSSAAPAPNLMQGQTTTPAAPARAALPARR